MLKKIIFVLNILATPLWLLAKAALVIGCGWSSGGRLVGGLQSCSGLYSLSSFTLIMLAVGVVLLFNSSGLLAGRSPKTFFVSIVYIVITIISFVWLYFFWMPHW